MALALLRQQFAWRAVYITGWAHNGDEGDGGEGSVCLITFLVFRLLESVFRNSAKCLVITGKITLIPVNTLFTHFL